MRNNGRHKIIIGRSQNNGRQQRGVGDRDAMWQLLRGLGLLSLRKPRLFLTYTAGAPLWAAQTSSGTTQSCERYGSATRMFRSVRNGASAGPDPSRCPFTSSLLLRPPRAARCCVMKSSSHLSRHRSPRKALRCGQTATGAPGAVVPH